MSNAEQTLRLLRELERLEQDPEMGATSSSAGVTEVALLEALVENGFDLTAAILDAANGA